MAKRIINVDDVEAVTRGNGDRFEASFKPIGAAIGSKMLGFNVTVIPPGRRAFPYHAHRGNEEMFFVLEGEGSVRIDGETHRIRTGDFISLPPGRDSAHQIINDSKAPLRYLAVSTMQTPEVIEYPDSGKYGLMAGSSGGGRTPGPDTIRHIARVKDGVDYWEGEA